MEGHRWRTGAMLGTALLGAPACCVCASTMVRTPSGARRLGALQLGDVVLSLAVDSGELVATRIVGVRTARRECLRIVHAGGELVCTPDHPIYSPESGEYEPASRWVDGARGEVLVVGEAPAAAAVVKVEAFVGVREVVDVTVDAPMHNFVAGGLLVHNKSYVDMLYADVEAPSFVLEPDQRSKAFEIRACVDGRNPSAEAYGSYLSVSISTQADPVTLLGDMWFALSLEREAEVSTSFVDYASGTDPVLRLGSLSGVCLSPLSIVFERLDDLPDGAIGFTWEVSGATEPPPGTDLEDELVMEVTER